MTNGPYLAVGTGVANLLIAVSIERFVRYYSLGLARLLNARIAITVGTLSYSLYLWQQPWVHYDISRLQVFPVNIALAGICATLSFNLIERPFLRLRDRLRTIQ
jgi:peptidoglycan/LPS O-acetylase OafA/YrhL